MSELVLANRTADWHRLKALVLDSVSSPITPARLILQSNETMESHGSFANSHDSSVSNKFLAGFICIEGNKQVAATR